jgi:L-alanine-DL-glutamate epimerase-like enolase superfamily enzyme
MANLHVAFASPNARFVECALAPDNIRKQLLTEELRLSDGFAERPRAPGLGITLDEAFVAQHPFKPGPLEYA